MRRDYFVWLALGLFIPAPSFAHPGGLNAEGCHHNRKTGDYHCHGGGARPPTAVRALPVSPSVSQTPRAPMASPVSPSTNSSANSYNLPNGKSCYVGPRGGTYTLTPSGAKNYNGC